MNIVHQIIIAALLFSVLAVFAGVKMALRDALISWCLVRVLRRPGFTFLSKPGDMPLGIALVCRLLTAGFWACNVWFFARLLFILVPVTWKILVV